MNAVLTERLVAVAHAARRAGHGRKGEIYAAACKELGMSLATLMRKLKAVALTPPRKRRSDAGQSALTKAEASLISALVIESARKNDKRLYAVGDAVATLRANSMIRAESVDAASGEIRALSDSAIQRALRLYGLHPDQLLAPEPCAELASRHPNHVWQIDASLCVLYYLKPSVQAQANGLRAMAHDEFYKNKPKNVARIAADRVWSYEITDHASGWIYVEYVMGAESGENLCSVLINAMQERGAADLLHGVPRILMLDAGSANTAAMTRNLCRSLGIEMAVHKPGNARATGQVENARNLIERKFEPGLKFQPVNSLDELNALAKKWRMHFNATAVHGRHGRTRSEVWLRIRQDELVKAPSVEACRELAVAQPEPRKVSPKLRVSFRGVEYDVSSVPGVLVGETLRVTRNPWRDDAAQVACVDATGHDILHVVPAVAKDEYGFALDAATIGDTYARPIATQAVHARNALKRLVAEPNAPAGQAQDAAAGARLAKPLPFGGRLAPYRHLDDATLPAYLPRRGTAHALHAPTLTHAPLSVVEAARRLRSRLTEQGEAGLWQAHHFEWLATRYPHGVPEVQLDALFGELIGLAMPRLAASGDARC